MDKQAWFDHFTQTTKQSERPRILTAAKMRRYHDAIMANKFLWEDVLLRHSGDSMDAETMQKNHEFLYEHCKSNFWMICADIVRECVEGEKSE